MALAGNNPEKVRRRLPRCEREKLIVDEAVRFFAEVGFEGQTRMLAQRLGVTQPLLYRYFPDKDALIARVHQEVFLNSWSPAWEAILADLARPLAERLIAFYQHYIGMAFSYERVRIAMFAGLKDPRIAALHVAFLNEHLLMPVARALRAEVGLATDAVGPADIGLASGLHGAIAFVGVRRWIYGVVTADDVDSQVVEIINAFVAGAPATVRRINAAATAEAGT